jgi:DNA-binding response OmpR family regulator
VKVLVLEKEPGLARAIQRAFESDLFCVDVAPNAADVGELCHCIPYDCMILDLDGDALETVLAKLRQIRTDVPILALNALGSVQERIRAFKAGADDCLDKPFSMQELVVRIHAILRRRIATPFDKMRVADLELDRIRRKAIRQGKEISLTPREYAVLECLMQNVGRPVSRSFILEHAWNTNFEGFTNIVDVYINFLRVKLDRNFEPKLIQTAYGIGYLLAVPPEAAQK